GVLAQRAVKASGSWFFGSGHCTTRSPGWRNARGGVQVWL
ncbi:hypothetical protein A2U01_0118209, partial [Trifolium medium]|nr:hypothetical protein [Trifolium medium]